MEKLIIGEIIPVSESKSKQSSSLSFSGYAKYFFIKGERREDLTAREKALEKITGLTSDAVDIVSAYDGPMKKMTQEILNEYINKFSHLAQKYKTAAHQNNAAALKLDALQLDLDSERYLEHLKAAADCTTAAQALNKFITSLKAESRNYSEEFCPDHEALTATIKIYLQQLLKTNFPNLPADSLFFSRPSHPRILSGAFSQALQALSVPNVYHDKLFQEDKPAQPSVRQ